MELGHATTTAVAYFIKGLQSQCESLSFGDMKSPDVSTTDLPFIVPINSAAGTGMRDMRCFRSGDLFGASREVLIEHEGGHYRLRLTQANKLILTK